MGNEIENQDIYPESMLQFKENISPNKNDNIKFLQTTAKIDKIVDNNNNEDNVDNTSFTMNSKINESINPKFKDLKERETEFITNFSERIITQDQTKLVNNYLYEKKIKAKEIDKEEIIPDKKILKTFSSIENNISNTYSRPLPIGKINITKFNKQKKIILSKSNLDKYLKKNTKLKNNQPKDIQPTNNKMDNSNNVQYSNKALKISKNFIRNKSLDKCMAKVDKLNDLKRNRTISPDDDLIRRKTINRGNEVKNVQITHIICSSKPTNFHIFEKLNLNNFKSEPIQISKNDKVNLRKSGKSSYSSSCKNDIKPITQNLKGKTTIYQHARGIGMTNDKKGNINSSLYKSDIIKLEPIMKEREKEKIEHVENFRSNNKINNTDIQN